MNIKWNAQNYKENFSFVPQYKEILAETENALRGQLLIDGKWYIDYVRIRIRARKVNP